MGEDIKHITIQNEESGFKYSTYDDNPDCWIMPQQIDLSVEDRKCFCGHESEIFVQINANKTTICMNLCDTCKKSHEVSVLLRKLEILLNNNIL